MMTYRLEKGAPLTAEELDQNFKKLVLRIERIERLMECNHPKENISLAQEHSKGKE